ncbi:hypothetical protein Rhopal_006172-T1 [Rhodotorula paludigena]|uniref:DNA replication ATP-dependent helicase/nuclease DNA2 n=1 Tax=Rhodotorula paludigena TaxID=86838 RepID=A0AAV5GVQ1_9BASI|nr:hypothetical protein Rhopal_006172-T1 [Rhodotorula paludigena]
MGRVEAEDAFMAALFQDLDDAVFAAPPTSSAPQPGPSSSQQQRSRPAKKRPVTSQHALHPSVHHSPRKRVARPPLLPASSSPAPSARPTAVPRSHTDASASLQPFWDDPLAHPVLSQRSRAERDRTEREGGYAPGLGGAVKKKGRIGAEGRSVRDGEERGEVERRKKVRRVEVEIEGKENAERKVGGPWPRAPLGKGKGKERVVDVENARLKAEDKTDDEEFGPLLEGVDWDEAMLGFEDEGGPVEDGQGARIPRSKQYLRCTVEEVVESYGPTSRPQKILTVSSASFDGLRQVLLCDDWVDTSAEAGDIINLVDLPDVASSAADSPVSLTRSAGLLILHPDILVSSTKVADSSHCTRKAVLQELIRTLGGSTPSLLYGNMLHSLLQTCMAANRWDEEFRHARIDECVKESGGQLWTLDVSFEKARQELRDRSKEFEVFAERFVGAKPKADAFLSDPRAVDTARSRLAITSTIGIEDDIWSPRFGLKGKIDVSTTSTFTDSVGFSRKSTTPFEVKTGRTNAGMEHRAQTMLYTLLMSDRHDQEVDSGLLYYTQSNEVFRVQAARNELRGLILARNRFATFLHRRMTLSPAGPFGASQCSAERSSPPTGSQPLPALKREEQTVGGDDDDAALWDAAAAPACSGTSAEGEALLPPPIDDGRSCKKCYVRDACMLFRRAVDGDLEISLDEQDPLQLQYEESVGHLTDEHATFFREWEKLISLEEQELVRFKKEIWTLQAEEREKLGRCFANMVISEVKLEDTAGAPHAHRFTYRLRPQRAPQSQSTGSLLGGSISVNDPIVISLEDPPLLALSRGFVLSLTPYEVVVGIDRSLTNLPQASQAVDHVFRVDKDELAAGMGRIRDNLIQLYVAGGDERKRRLIVDLEPPAFDASLFASKERLVPSTLNSDQKLALEKVLAAQDYALILGMPGTGKTTTIAEVIRALAKAGKSVLLTSYTHSAVDNILLKIKDDGMNILRLGNRDKILPSLHDLTLTPEDYATSLTDIDNKLMTPQVVATTCLGINEPIFVKRRFDVCIVDEASQVTLPTCLGPLRFADKFILVGDHHQLPPLVRNHAARKGGLDISLFKRLSDAHPSAVVNLTHQYRMNADIMLLSNKLVYSNRLQVGDERVGLRRLALPGKEMRQQLEPWLRDIVDPKRAVLFVDTDALPARERRQGSLIDNESEARLVKQTVSALSTCGVSDSDIGVITLYRQQIKVLSRELQDFPGVEVLTADRSQGRDKECILISLVRSNTGGHVGDLLKDWRRLNVCLTRAKSKLVLFGSRSTLAHNELMRQLLHLVDDQGWTYLLPASLGPQSAPRQVKSEVKEEDDVDEKPVRRGGGALALRAPLANDVVNSL